MAKVNFNDLDVVESNQGNSGSGSNVGFFNLRNNGDEAIVRFMCDTVDDFEILTCHDVQVGTKYHRKVACIRDPREPLDKCPMCASGAKISTRFFIKMIQYNRVTDQNTGAQTIVPQAVVWERSTAYARTLKSYMDNYGPLSEIICKVIRHGNAGDMQTTYEIVPNLSKNVYPDEVYVKDPTLFGDFEAFGTFVMDRNADEMRTFLTTGQFPARASQVAAANAEVTPRTYPQAAPEASQSAVTAQPANVPPTGGYGAPVNNGYGAPAAGGYGAPVAPQPTAPNNQPWNTPTTPAGGFDRPRRY